MQTLDLELMLAGRRGATPPARPWALKLLSDGVIGYESASVMAQPGKMAVTCRISTPNLDRSRDVVIGKGIDTANHARNPLALFNHARWQPVGRAMDPDGNYTVKVGDAETVATTYFFQDMFEAEQAFRLVEMGALNGASVGFRPKPNGVKVSSDDDGQLCVIEACELIEYSHVFFPDNPDCLVSAVEKGLGGRPLCPMLRDAIVPLLPARKAWSPGADMTQPTKPTCSCEYPRVKCRNGSGHGQKCAVHKAWLAAGGFGNPTAAAQVLKDYTAPAPTTPVATADATADAGPTLPGGAQYLAALHAILAEALEFIEANSPALEPEVAESLGGLAEQFVGLSEQLATSYGERYPDLPALDEAPEAEDDTTDADTVTASEGDDTVTAADGDDATTDDTEDDDTEDKDDEDDDEDQDDKPKMTGGWRTKLLATLTRWRKRAADRRKRLSKSTAAVVTEAADHLDDCAQAKEWTRTHKSASALHAKALRKLCKGMDDDADDDGDAKALAAPTLDFAAVSAALKPVAAGLKTIRTDLAGVTGKAV
jgi:hypothetical protein